MQSTPQRLGRQAGSVSVWHPENLDVDALVESYGQRVAEGVLWLGHCVYTGLANDARCRDTGRVPLQTVYLRNVVGRHQLDAVREAAAQAGYVERDRSYRAGDRSQAYWIPAPYDCARLVRWPVMDAGLCYRIARWRESRRREMWQRIRRDETPVDAAVCDHLWRNLRRVRIDGQIDFGTAFHPAHQVAAEHIQAGELWFIVDDFGRIHTNLTNLPMLRRCDLTVDGQRLVNVDIGESQPLFVGLAIVWGRNGRETDGQGKGRQGKGSHGPAYHMLDSIMLDKSSYLGGGLERKRLPTDLRCYLESCESRGLYQAVADRLGKTRDEAKKKIMAVFFDKPWHHNAVSRVLDELFPTVMEAMREIKRPDYKCLAHFAQGVESAFMFGRVVPRIMEERPDLFISTIHDSILTTSGDEEFVRGVMLEEFARLGLSPQVNAEPCFGPEFVASCNRRPTHRRKKRRRR